MSARSHHLAGGGNHSMLRSDLSMLRLHRGEHMDGACASPPLRGRRGLPRLQRLPTGAICTARAPGRVAASPPSRKVASESMDCCTRASREHAWKSQSAGCTQWDEAVRVLSWRGKAAILAG